MIYLDKYCTGGHGVCNIIIYNIVFHNFQLPYHLFKFTNVTEDTWQQEFLGPIWQVPGKALLKSFIKADRLTDQFRNGMYSCYQFTFCFQR